MSTEPGYSYLNKPGRHSISIDSKEMGTGEYTVTVNSQVQPEGPSILLKAEPGTDFGQVIVGGSSAPHDFKIAYWGTPGLNVEIRAVRAEDPHYQIISPPVGQRVPPDKTFQVTYNAGAIPGVYQSIITVSWRGVTQAGSVITEDAVVPVTGTTVPNVLNVPNIDCKGSCDEGPVRSIADSGEVKPFTVEFQNKGAAPLNLSSTTVVSDVPDVFSPDEEPSTEPLRPDGTRAVRVCFSPKEVGRDFCGHLLIRSNDPDGPEKSCYFRARGHHPPPA